MLLAAVAVPVRSGGFWQARHLGAAVMAAAGEASREAMAVTTAAVVVSADLAAAISAAADLAVAGKSSESQIKRFVLVKHDYALYINQENQFNHINQRFRQLNHLILEILS